MASNHLQLDWLRGLGLSFGGSLSTVPEQQVDSVGEMAQFEQLDRANASSNTLKRNPKMELSKNDLLKLVTYFEGEIQARDIAIAALKSERLKQVANLGRYRPSMAADPYTALLRDSVADTSSAKVPFNEKDMAAAAEAQLQALEHLASQQRRAHQHMMNILRDAEAKHKKVIQELEEEKCKHEHDTAQGDDITYGLEMERTRLRQELEMERTARKKLEKEVKRQLEMADEERGRQKQIVLLLLAERKKIIVKYIEERKRSEDLAQILSEEKSRIDSMAEGLEEESKKSLQMEAELEKQVHVFDADKKLLNSQLIAKETRCQELELEVAKLKAEIDHLKSRCGVSCDNTAPMISSVAKVVQPTATVSSVPVSAPTTGFAQSVTPGQVLRQTATVPPVLLPGKMATVSSLSSSTNSPASATMVGGNVRPQQKMGTVAAAAFQYQNASTAPQTPPKKGAAAARGVPPPIPPNKPIIPNKQPAPRRPDCMDNGDKKKVNLCTTNKDNIAQSCAGISGGVAGNELTSATRTTSGSGQGIEILGQELADFQQMFVTMATSNNT